MNVTRKIEVYDTTLRDGNQGEGVNLSLADKIALAKMLDELGIDFAEGGWPGSNPKDNDFFLACQDAAFEHVKICLLYTSDAADE